MIMKPFELVHLEVLLNLDVLLPPPVRTVNMVKAKLEAKPTNHNVWWFDIICNCLLQSYQQEEEETM